MKLLSLLLAATESRAWASFSRPTFDHALTVTVSLTVAVSVTVSFSVTVVVTKTVETLGFTGMTVIPGPSVEKDEVTTGAEAAAEDSVEDAVLTGIDASVEEASVAELVVLELSVDAGFAVEGDGVYAVLGSVVLPSGVLV